MIHGAEPVLYRLSRCLRHACHYSDHVVVRVTALLPLSQRSPGSHRGVQVAPGFQNGPNQTCIKRVLVRPLNIQPPLETL